MTKTPALPAINPRALVRWGAGAITITALPLTATATPADVTAAINKAFGTGKITDGRVKLTLPPIAENGFSVPLDISIVSPMTPIHYVKRVAVYAERNPLPDMSQFHLTPLSGKAEIRTRIRMGGTQTITAIAEMNDGSLWRGTAQTVVTLAACVVL